MRASGVHALALAAGLVACTFGFSASGQGLEVGDFGMTDPALARSDYIESCGGCHGVNGSTAPAEVPELRGRAGYFMCTPETRAYLLRLPNVAHSRIADNQRLAELMNYVVFVLGEGTVRAGSEPFTGEEVAHERKLALSSVNLTQERSRMIDIVMRECQAPESLKAMYDPPATQ